MRVVALRIKEQFPFAPPPPGREFFPKATTPPPKFLDLGGTVTIFP